MFSPGHPLQLALGLIIWSIWFVLIYAMLSIACSVSPPSGNFSATTWINTALLLLTVMTTVLLGFLAYRCWQARAERGNAGFTARVASCVYVVAAVATFAIGLPVLALPPCI